MLFFIILFVICLVLLIEACWKERKQLVYAYIACLFMITGCSIFSVSRNSNFRCSITFPVFGFVLEKELISIFGLNFEREKLVFGVFLFCLLSNT